MYRVKVAEQGQDLTDRPPGRVDGVRLVPPERRAAQPPAAHRQLGNCRDEDDQDVARAPPARAQPVARAPPARAPPARPSRPGGTSARTIGGPGRGLSYWISCRVSGR